MEDELKELRKQVDHLGRRLAALEALREIAEYDEHIEKYKGKLADTFFTSQAFPFPIEGPAPAACPFAGAHMEDSSLVQIESMKDCGYWAVCSACGAQGPLALDVEAAMEGWNAAAGAVPKAAGEWVPIESFEAEELGRYWVGRPEAFRTLSLYRGGSFRHHSSIEAIITDATMVYTEPIRCPEWPAEEEPAL